MSERTTSDADLLRKAAALMRERAEAATDGPWAVTSTTAGLTGILSTSGIAPTVYSTHVGAMRSDDMRHIAGMHPAVALAVADWLDEVGATDDDAIAALAVARAYLGSDE